MTSFESFLVKKGYVKKVFDFKTMTYKEPKHHIISTMVNLDHRYLKDGKEIIFGLNEAGKPPTLIYPRPNIELTRNGKIEDNTSDDAMNVVLSKIDHEIIYQSMFNNQVIQVK